MKPLNPYAPNVRLGPRRGPGGGAARKPTAAKAPPPPSPHDGIARDIVRRMHRIMRHIAVGIERPWLRCGKAACARRRRCRGTACDRPVA